MFFTNHTKNMMSASAPSAEASFFCADFAADCTVLTVGATFVASIIILSCLSLAVRLSLVLVLAVLLVQVKQNMGKSV